MNQLKIIKAIVFTFTFLLIFGTLVLLSKLYQKANGNEQNAQSTENSLGLSAGFSIRQIAADNSLLYIWASDSQTKDHIIIYNPDKSRIISDITLN